MRKQLPFVPESELQFTDDELDTQSHLLVFRIVHILDAKGRFECPEDREKGNWSARVRMKAFGLFSTYVAKRWMARKFGDIELGYRYMKAVRRCVGISRESKRSRCDKRFVLSVYTQPTDFWDNCPPEKRHYLISDMEKLPIPVMAYVLRTVHHACSPDTFWEHYLDAMKSVPDILYVAPIWAGRYLAVHRHIGALPSKEEAKKYTTIQWRVMTLNAFRGWYTNPLDVRLEDWRLFCSEILGKKLSPMSFMVSRMFHYVTDGQHIYSRHKDDGWYGTPSSAYGYELRDCSSGTFNKRLRNAMFNHHQECLIRAKEMESKEAELKEKAQPCNLRLPEHLEEVRIKTQWDMVKAGNECHHCIGGYAGDDGSLFFRKGSVCAQVTLSDMKVMQCFDAHDQITDASKNFSRWLNRQFAPLRTQIQQKEKQDEQAVHALIPF